MTNTSSTWYKADIHLMLLEWLLELLANNTVSAVCYTLVKAVPNTTGHRSSCTITCVLEILKIDITSTLFHTRLSLSRYKINQRAKEF